MIQSRICAYRKAVNRHIDPPLQEFDCIIFNMFFRATWMPSFFNTLPHKNHSFEGCLQILTFENVLLICRLFVFWIMKKMIFVVLCKFLDSQAAMLVGPAQLYSSETKYRWPCPLPDSEVRGNDSISYTKASCLWENMSRGRRRSSPSLYTFLLNDQLNRFCGAYNFTKKNTLFIHLFMVKIVKILLLPHNVKWCST